MDKNTLSTFGWIIVTVIILSLMIAFATPFGDRTVELLSAVPGQISQAFNWGGENDEGEEQHTHSYTAQNASPQFLKKEATCYEKAVYYYSCSTCGVAGTASFESGAVDPENHSGGTKTKYIFVDGNTHTVKVDCVGCKETISELPENHQDNGNNVCTKCNKTLHEHDFSKEEPTEEHLAVEATCKNSASYYYSCSICNANGTAVFEYGTPRTHDYSAKNTEDSDLKTAANCGSPAVYYYSCSYCGENNSTTFESGGPDANNHIGDVANVYSWINTSTHRVRYICETCDGERSTTTQSHTVGGNGDCTLCSGLAHEHDYSAQNTDAKYVVSKATCIKQTVYNYSCSVCGDEGSETFEAGEFNPENHKGKTRKEYEWINASTHTTKIICEDCDELISSSTAAHTDDGTGNCENCGKIAHEHTYTKKVVSDEYRKSEATCKTPALYYYLCSVCNHKGDTTYENGSVNASNHIGETRTEYKYVDKTNHNVNTVCVGCDKVLESTSEAHNKGANDICTKCGGDAHVHNHTEQNTDISYRKSEATCTAKAVYYYSCACGDKSTEKTFEYGEALAHDYSVKNTDDEYRKSEATCESPAIYYYICSGCGAKGSNTYEHGTAIDHIYSIGYMENEGNKISAATCQSPACYGYVCYMCEAVYTETQTFTNGEVDPSNHAGFTVQNASDDYIATEATCKAKATYYYSCVCGATGSDTFESGSFDSDNHTNVQVSNYESIDDSTHTVYAVCKGCMNPVTYTEDHDIVNDTCTKCGYTTSVAVTATVEIQTDYSPYEFTYVVGMTWGDLVNSEYNTNNLLSVNSSNQVILNSNSGGPLPTTYIAVTADLPVDYASSYALNGMSRKVCYDSSTVTGGTTGGDSNSCSHEETTTAYTQLDNAQHTAITTCTSCSEEIGRAPENHSLGANNTCSKCEYVKALAPGLYETGTLNLIKPWDTLISEGILDSNGAIIEGREGSLAGDLVLPDTLTSIPDYAFYNCENLTSVTIPDSVTSIGGNAFLNCYSITNVNLGVNSQLETIGANAFRYCTNLESIALEKTSQLKTIGAKAFTYCKSLTDFYVPKNVTSIGQCLLGSCHGIESIIVDSDNTTYHSDGNCIIETQSNALIMGCNNSTIPSYVTSLATYAFSDCNKLSDVVLPNGLTTIGTNVFYKCSSLTSITIPDSVTYIGGSAFSGCSGLISVIFENTSGWFVSSSSSATSGTSVDVTNYTTNKTNLVSTYRSYYWKRCTHTGSVTTTWKYLNNEQHKVINTCVNCGGKASEIAEDHIFDANNTCTKCGGRPIAPGLYETGSNYTILLKTWDELVDEEIVNFQGSGYSLIAGKSSELVGDLVISDAITGLNSLAFKDCTGLTGLIIPGSISDIPTYSFNGCTSLVSVVINEGVKSIGAAFNDCTSLTTVVLADSVTSAFAAFQGCTNLVDVTLGKGMTSINGYMFWDCGLVDFVIPSGVTIIEERAFGSCDNLTKITIPTSVTSIEERAFYRCEQVDFYYEGTIAQWKAIRKSVEWIAYAGAYTIYCTDGEIAGSAY